MRLTRSKPFLTRLVASLVATVFVAALVPAGAMGAPIADTVMPRDTKTAAAIGFSEARDAAAVHSSSVGALASDDQIPGIVVSSPYNGVINLISGDYVDVFQVTIGAGEVFTAEVTSASNEWVAAALLPPGSTDVWTDPVAELSTSVSFTQDRLSQYSSTGPAPEMSTV